MSPRLPAVLVVEHERDVDLGLIADRLARADLTVDIVGPERGRPIPASLQDYDGLIVLGGTMDPVDDAGAPWLPRVRGLLREAVRDQVPTMGVCLGAQLLGMAVGSRAPGSSRPGPRWASASCAPPTSPRTTRCFALSRPRVDARSPGTGGR